MIAICTNIMLHTKKNLDNILIMLNVNRKWSYFTIVNYYNYKTITPKIMFIVDRTHYH